MRKTIKLVHSELKKTHPHIIKKVSEHPHFKYKYPKLTLFALTVVLAYLIFRNPAIASYLSHLGSLSYLGIFIGGLLFSYGFTTPFAVGLFVTIEPNNIILAALIGGFGAYLADFTIFSLIRSSFMPEFKEIEKTKPIRTLEQVINNNLNKKLKLYLLYVFSGFIIASPLPDELAVALLAGLGHIKPSVFSIISFLCNTLGILVMLLL
jgi:hypothetical protein